MKITNNIWVKILGSCLFLLGITSNIQGQTDADLLRYSVLNYSGNPRFTAMGGSFGALGANFSAISINPASLGLYSRHEVSVAASVTTTYNKATYYGETHQNEYARFNLPELGSVWLMYDRPKDKGLKRIQFAVGVNRVNDFNGATTISGFNTTSSYMEAVAAQNYGALPPSKDNEWGGLNVPGYLAYNSFLIDPVKNSQQYNTFLRGGNLQQGKTWYNRGNTTELSLAFGANVSDKLFLGINFAVPFISYHQRSTFSEGNTQSKVSPNPYQFRSYEYTENFSTSAIGFTFKLGAMYQVFPFMRIGAWLHTPSYYSHTEEYRAEIHSKMTLPSNGGGSTDKETPTSEYKYRISTPTRGGLAFGFIIGKYGVVNIEGELLNYRGMRFTIRDDVAYEISQNQIVKDNYKLGGVVRLGTEWRAGIGRFRLGYVFQSSPYRNEDLSKAWQNHTFSGGLGLVVGKWSVDFAVAYYMQKEDYYLYNLVDASNQPLVMPARLNNNKLVYNLGVSIKF